MSFIRRYQNYGYHTPSSSSASLASSCTAELEKKYHHNDCNQSSECAVENHSTTGTNGLRNGNERSSYSSRLEYIGHSMAYIRGELDELKESDRALLDIFKQLENNVEELGDNISNWRLSGSFTPGRPTSFSDLDTPNFSSTSSSSSRIPHTDRSVGGTAYTMNSLETILDSSKEDITSLKEENIDTYSALADSALVPDSSLCSPLLQGTLKFQFSNVSSIRSSCGSGSATAKRFSDGSMQLRGSMSSNKLANSPSISRLQDDGGSTMSRNSSIDSGIQFASEVENSSSNGVIEAVVRAPIAASPKNVDVTSEDMRKSVGFADDIFAALGI